MIKNEREIYTELQNVLERHEELTSEDALHVLKESVGHKYI